MPEYEKETTEQQRLEKEQLEDLGTVWRTRGPHAIHCLTVIGQIEGHVEAPQGQKTTKYEHVITQLVAVQEDPAIEGLLVLLNTVGGDVEAGLALAELIASISKPSAAVVLGGFFYAENLRKPYCYIDGVAIYDKEAAMQATVYLQGLSDFGDQVRMVDELIINE